MRQPRLTKQEALEGAVAWLDEILQAAPRGTVSLPRGVFDSISDDLQAYKAARDRGKL